MKAWQEAAGVAVIGGISFFFGTAWAAYQDSAKCAESAETTRMQACVRAGGSWVAGNCVGPLPAPPEGK